MATLTIRTGMVTRLMDALRHLRAVPVLMALNLLVYVTWRIALASEPLAVFMSENFCTNLAALRAGRPWTLLTAAFSHIAAFHVLLNMVVLLSFGAILETRWGARRFTWFYVLAGICASLFHAAFSALGWPDIPAVGASGAISGLLVAYVFLYPRHKILFFMLIPLPAWVAGLLFVGIDVWGLVAQRGGGGFPIGHGAHLGGGVFGAVWSLVTLWRGRGPVGRQLSAQRRMSPP